MSSFLYNRLPLNSARSSIRVLVLQPASWDEPLEAQMEVVKLVEDPIYDTLSYVWGKENPKDYQNSIQIDKIHVPVPRTLFDALRRLRSYSEAGSAPLTILVDALCINQLCISERNCQVQIMGKIYSSCRQVHIWMNFTETACKRTGAFWAFTGDDADYSKNWDEYCKHFNFTNDGTDKVSILSYSRYYRSDMFMAWIFRELAEGNHLSSVTAFLPILCTDRGWTGVLKHAILSFLFDEWFYRLWVVQEAALAPAGRVYFGSVSMPLHTIISAASNYNFHLHHRCCEVIGLNRDAVDQNLASLLDDFQQLDLLRHNSGRKSTMLELSLRFMKREATQPHDFAYAMLGLANSHITPDYGTKLIDLLLEVSQEHIRLTDNLLPLSFGRLTSAKFPSLPTWVVDLSLPQGKSTPNPRDLVWLAQIPVFNCSSGLRQKNGLAIVDNTLHLDGVKFDRIETTSNEVLLTNEGLPYCFALYDLSVAAGEPWEDRQDKECPISSWAPTPGHLDAPYPSGGTWRNAWWRTILQDHAWGSAKTQRASNRHISTLTMLGDFWTSSKTPNGEGLTEYLQQSAGIDKTSFEEIKSEENDYSNSLLMNTIHEHLNIVTENKKLFLTEKGYLGIANRDILEQDEIFILPGSTVPIVLRPSMPSLNGEHGTVSYQNVGDCYLHGIMDGEDVNEINDTMQSLIVI